VASKKKLDPAWGSALLQFLQHQAGGYGPHGDQPYQPVYGLPQTNAEARWQQMAAALEQRSPNGGVQGRPIPNADKRVPRPLPNASGKMKGPKKFGNPNTRST
jgi:hypothetical protein